ncbi:receptor-transporting protein 3 [Xenopus laevis]|uniref:3CxxC-type domain-containing protein n=2 Tax=Xenopus laevis TaxID=8355 RepID=A0A974CWE5_XENLA|nr:receptor-transporting protein 3 [Xenopus laevis]OCT80653.1 hypothetical protein XELAEV_18027466mg [Xenopus laevis]
MLRLAMGNDKWSVEFDNEIEELDTTDLWTLNVIENSLPNGGLKYERTTFGSFVCSNCRYHWSSVVTHLRFFIKLDRARKRGIVNMRISRQSCKKCNLATMEKPHISDANLKIMIKNLVLKINRTFYEPKDYGRRSRPINYYSDQNGPHDKDHCEICQEDAHQEKKDEQGSFYLREDWEQGTSLHEKKTSEQGGSTALAVGVTAGVAAGLGALALACMAFANHKDSSKK